MATLFFCELSTPARSALLVRSARSARPACSARPARSARPAGKSAQNPRICARKARKWRSRRPKAHKKPDFVLETPENGGPGPQKRTKTPILCSKSQKMGVPKAKSAQKPRFCARNARKRRFQTPKAHKKPDFVLESAENGGSEGHISTKAPILCSGRRGLAPGRGEISIGKRNRCLPANHRAHLKNIST